MERENSFNTPKGWTIHAEEVSANQFRVVAVATDGRRIEANGSDGEKLMDEVRASIEQFETEENYRKAGLERES